MLPMFIQIQNCHQVEEMMIFVKPKGIMPKKRSQTELKKVVQLKFLKKEYSMTLMMKMMMMMNFQIKKSMGVHLFILNLKLIF